MGRTRLVDPPLEGSLARHSMGRRWSLLHSYTTQSLLESPTLTPPGRGHHWFRLGVVSCPHSRNKLSRAGPLGLVKTEQASPPLGWHQPSPLEGSEFYASPWQHSHACSNPQLKPLREMSSEGPSSEWPFLSPIDLSSVGQGHGDLGR